MGSLKPLRGVALVHPEPDLCRELDRAVPVGELQSSYCLVCCLVCCCYAAAAVAVAAAAAAVAAAVVVAAGAVSAAGTGGSVWPLPHGLLGVVAVISAALRVSLLMPCWYPSWSRSSLDLVRKV